MTVYAVIYKNDWNEAVVDCLCKTLELANNRVEYLRELDYETWVKEMPILEN